MTNTLNFQSKNNIEFYAIIYGILLKQKKKTKNKGGPNYQIGNRDH